MHFPFLGHHVIMSLKIVNDVDVAMLWCIAARLLATFYVGCWLYHVVVATGYWLLHYTASVPHSE